MVFLKLFDIFAIFLSLTVFVLYADIKDIVVRVLVRGKLYFVFD